MKYGIREICDVVLKAKANQKVGNKIFYKNEPVIYFDTLKTSTMEGAATTVYAQGGRGNARLMAWEGERTVTFTMEDALISPAGFMILSGAGLIDGSEKPIYVHQTEQTDKVKVLEDGSVEIRLSQKPHWTEGEDCIYVMRMVNGEVDSEPYFPDSEKGITEDGEEFVITLSASWSDDPRAEVGYADSVSRTNDLAEFKNGDVVLVDYYVEKAGGTREITITPDKFGGNYYLEASTLFRNTDGVDMPAEFIIPNCKIQSNFTFTMASSGDPSTFTFTMDAFPDYTRFDKTKKVLAVIQVIESAEEGNELVRISTVSKDWEDRNGMIDGNRTQPETGE